MCVAAWVVLLASQRAHEGHSGAWPELWHWMLMVAGMMLPLAQGEVRAAAEGSLWGRRNRAIAGFLTGYSGPWLALGLAAAWARQEAWAHQAGAAAFFFGISAAWMAVPWRRRALAECHRRSPLAPTGWKADRDCLRFGGMIGLACVTTCWPMMLACAFTGHNWVAMMGGTAVAVLERWPYQPREGPARRATAALAVYYLVLALVPQAPAFAQQATVVAATTAPFTLGPAKTQVTLTAAGGKGFAHVGHTAGERYYLGVEDIRSDRESPAFAVYLQPGLKAEDSTAAQQFAGQMPMFGIQEATRGKTGERATGLTYRFEVTELLRRLATRRDWNGKVIRAVFVGERWDGPVAVRVGRVVLTKGGR